MRWELSIATATFSSSSSSFSDTQTKQNISRRVITNNRANELFMSLSCLLSLVTGKKLSHTNHTSLWIISETRACYWRFISKRLKHNWIQNSLFKHDLIACILCSLCVFACVFFSLSVRMLFSLCHCAGPFRLLLSSRFSSRHQTFSDMTAITMKKSVWFIIWYKHSKQMKFLMSESDLISTIQKRMIILLFFSLTLSLFLLLVRFLNRQEQ